MNSLIKRESEHILIKMLLNTHELESKSVPEFSCADSEFGEQASEFSPEDVPSESD